MSYWEQTRLSDVDGNTINPATEEKQDAFVQPIDAANQKPVEKKNITPEIPKQQGFTFEMSEVQLLFDSLLKDENVILAQKVNSGNAKLKLAIDIETALDKMNKKS